MTTPEQQSVIDLLVPPAQAAAEKHGTWPSVCIAQAILETGWGKSALARDYNAWWGVKWHGDPSGPYPPGVTGSVPTKTTERRDRDGGYVIAARFRTYASIEDSALDYGENLRAKSVYADTGCWEARTAEEFIRAIGPVYTGGDRTYAEKVLDIIERYDLTRYDSKEVPVATPVSADRVLAALKAEGLRVVEIPGWKTHNRNRVGKWGPVHGIMVHYTAGEPPLAQQRAYAKNILYDGYAGLPGPLCQFGVATDGTVFMTGWGRCNHAGKINSAMLDKVINGSMSLDRTETPGPDEIDGNSRLYGIENINNGEITTTQYDVSVKICAALCKLHGWNGRDVMSHGEGTRRKAGDPPRTNMGHFRRAVMARVAEASKPAPQPATPRALEDPMPTHTESRTTVTTDGTGWRVTDPLVKPSARRLRLTASARVTAPEGVTIRTRWVSWDNTKKAWVRYPVTEHPGHEGETTTVIGQAWPGADVRLDVWTSQPAEVAVHASALVWEIS